MLATDTGRLPYSKKTMSHPYRQKPNQGESSSAPVTSDLSKTFHQICLWLHQLVKTKKEYRRQCNLFARLPATRRWWLANTNKQTGYHSNVQHPTATCQQHQTTDSGLERSAVWNVVLWELALQTCSSEFVLYFIFITFFLIFIFIFIFYFYYSFC